MLKIKPPALLRSGRYDYAPGLIWQPAARKGWREAVKSAKSIPGADHYVQLSHPGGIQTGLTSLRGVRHQRVLSLAAVASVWREGDWLGIFQTAEDRYWFIAIINGAVSPLTDVCGDMSAIRAALDTFRQFQPLPEFVVAPPEFGLPDSEPVAWTEILPARPPKQARLAPLSIKKPVIILVLFLLLTGGGWHAFSAWQEAREQARIAAQQAAILAHQRALQAMSPWKKIPTPQAFMTACSALYRQLPLSVGGWLFSGAECRADGIRAAYSRSSALATVSDFAQRITTRYRIAPGFNLQDGGRVADFTLPYPAFPASAFHDDKPETGSQAAFPLVSFFQQQAQSFQFVPDTSPADQPVAWKSYRFTTTSGLPPASWISGMPLNGVRLNSLRLTMTGDSLLYEMQGVFYAKN
ncbi:type 4b pilus protein PilO2 [Enterobacter kobei]|uniref:type 4b pilus protein PilO2 n=1 Tax=Enterobacter kobei TaxID=208224 RepID=UPI003CEB14D8